MRGYALRVTTGVRMLESIETERPLVAASSVIGRATIGQSYAAGVQRTTA